MIKNKNFNKEYSLDLALAHENFYEDNFGCSLEKILSFRNFKSYYIKADAEQNKQIFQEIQSNVREIVKNNDGNNGVHVQFNTKTKYGDVIRILDICQIEKAPTYVLEDYDVWIMAGTNIELRKNCPYTFKKQ